MTPVARGLYLADRVEADPTTRNLTLVNCFRAMRLPADPAAPRPFYLVAYLANGFGETRVGVAIQRLDTLADIHRTGTVVRFEDRLAEIRFVIRVENCRFDAHGMYQAELYADGRLLTATPFRVLPPRE